MDKVVSSKKSFNDIQQMVSLARQCMSSEINIKQYQTKQKLCNLLDYFNLSAYILTKHEMFMGKNNNMQNIILCLEHLHCLYIDNVKKQIIYYSLCDKEPSLLLKRFISIHFPNHDLTVLYIETHYNNDRICELTKCLLFVLLTTRYTNKNRDELLDILVDEFCDFEFVVVFDEMCNIITSQQKKICKLDFSRPKGFNELLTITEGSKKANNTTRVMDILYDIVLWCCETIKTDEQNRNNLLCKENEYDKHIESVKQNMRISGWMCHTNMTKVWNRLNYELTLNTNNIRLIKKTIQNIIHCGTLHYKYLIHMCLDLLQTMNEKDMICQNTLSIMSLTEEYDDKINCINCLADNVLELIDDIFKLDSP